MYFACRPLYDYEGLDRGLLCPPYPENIFGWSFFFIMSYLYICICIYVFVYMYLYIYSEFRQRRVPTIICWCVRSSIVNVVWHALSREPDEFICSLPFYVRMIFPLRCSVCPGPPIVSHRVSFMLIFLSSHLDSRIFCAQLCPRTYLRPRASLIGHGPAQFRPRASITSATGQHNFGHGPA